MSVRKGVVRDCDLPMLAKEGDTAWMAQGACKGLTALFYDGHSDDLAIAVCRTCPVMDICAKHADEHGEQFGVWGGVRRFPKSQASCGTYEGVRRHQRRAGEDICPACQVALDDYNRKRRERGKVTK